LLRDIHAQTAQTVVEVGRQVVGLDLGHQRVQRGHVVDVVESLIAIAAAAAVVLRRSGSRSGQLMLIAY